MWGKLVLGFIALVVGFLIGCAVGVYVQRSSGEQHATPADLSQLLSHPDNFSGRLVRVSGKLDECFSWECSLCPESMTTANADRKRCLPLEFRPLVRGTGFGERETESVFRFSTVTLVAKFDPTCLSAPCLDRGTVLQAADVTDVKLRQSSREGLWVGHSTPLREAPELLNILRAEALKAGFPVEPVMKVYAVSGAPDTAVTCWTWAGENSWPTSLEGALYAKSTVDFYNCSKARKITGSWVFQVQDQ